jgi:hypothetical protein
MTKKAVLIYGRMNPPHLGHKLLFEKMGEQEGDKFIILSPKQDNDGQLKKARKDPSNSHEILNNPLDWISKAFLLTKLFLCDFPNIKLVMNDEISGMSAALGYMRLMGYEELTLICGEDRVEDYRGVFERSLKFLSSPFKRTEVISSGDRDPDSDGVEGVSSTKLRLWAIYGETLNFYSAVRGFNPTSTAKEIYVDMMYNNLRDYYKKVLK